MTAGCEPLIPVLGGTGHYGRPFNPYLHALMTSTRLLHSFTLDIVARVAQHHQRLLDTFDYPPTTLEMQAGWWAARSGGGEGHGG